MMKTRDEIIKALQCCIDLQKNSGKETGTCDICPYTLPEECTCRCLDGLLQDTLDLIKSCEPRVMTLDEAKEATRSAKVVWAEMRGDRVYAGIRVDGENYLAMENNSVIDQDDFNSQFITDSYNTRFRYWTGEPTEEQRQAVAWNDLPPEAPETPPTT